MILAAIAILAAGILLSPERNVAEVTAGARDVIYASPSPATFGDGRRIYLAGDGWLEIVDVESGGILTIAANELGTGGWSHRILRRGDRFVTWAYRTYIFGSEIPPRPVLLVDDSWILIPSAAEDRIWVGIVEYGDPRRLTAVREVDTFGRVTHPDTPPPDGAWPHAALESGLVFVGPTGITVWDPRRDEVVAHLAGEMVLATAGDLIAWCGGSCETITLTDVAKGEEMTIDSMRGRYWFGFRETGVFSPDRRILALPLGAGPDTSDRRQLALIDARTGEVTRAEGTTVQAGYVLVRWAPDGQTVYVTGGNQTREILEYPLTDGVARRIPAVVGQQFYDFAVL